MKVAIFAAMAGRGSQFKDFMTVNLDNFDKFIVIGPFFDLWRHETTRQLDGEKELETIKELVALKKKYETELTLIFSKRDARFLKKLDHPSPESHLLPKKIVTSITSYFAKNHKYFDIVAEIDNSTIVCEGITEDYFRRIADELHGVHYTDIYDAINEDFKADCSLTKYSYDHDDVFEQSPLFTTTRGLNNFNAEWTEQFVPRSLSNFSKQNSFVRGAEMAAIKYFPTAESNSFMIVDTEEDIVATFPM